MRVRQAFKTLWLVLSKSQSTELLPPEHRSCLSYAGTVYAHCRAQGYAHTCTNTGTHLRAAAPASLLSRDVCRRGLADELRAVAACSCDEKRGLDVSTRAGCGACTRFATEAASMGYGGEIPRAILAPHSSSPAKNLSPDTATSFPSGSALAIPYVSLPQQLLSITGLGKKGSSYPSAIDTGPGMLFARMFPIRAG